MIKYDESLFYSGGCFVTNKGYIIILNTDFEDFAASYCLGNNYDMEDSELTIEQLKLFKIWTDFYFAKNLSCDNMYSSFLIQVLGFDIINSEKNKIITSSSDYNYRYKEYLLRGFEVEVIDRFILQKNSINILNIKNKFKLKLLKYDEK